MAVDVMAAASTVLRQVSTAAGEVAGAVKGGPEACLPVASLKLVDKRRKDDNQYHHKGEQQCDRRQAAVERCARTRAMHT